MPPKWSPQFQVRKSTTLCKCGSSRESSVSFLRFAEPLYAEPARKPRTAGRGELEHLGRWVDDADHDELSEEEDSFVGQRKMEPLVDSEKTFERGNVFGLGNGAVFFPFILSQSRPAFPPTETAGGWRQSRPSTASTTRTTSVSRRGSVVRLGNGKYAVRFLTLCGECAFVMFRKRACHGCGVPS